MDKKTNTLKRITTVAGVGALIGIATVIYGATIIYAPMKEMYQPHRPRSQMIDNYHSTQRTLIDLEGYQKRFISNPDLNTGIETVSNSLKADIRRIGDSNEFKDYIRISKQRSDKLNRTLHRRLLTGFGGHIPTLVFGGLYFILGHRQGRLEELDKK